MLLYVIYFSTIVDYMLKKLAFEFADNYLQNKCTFTGKFLLVKYFNICEILKIQANDDDGDDQQ